MATETITITIPDSPKEQEEVLRFLTEKGLLHRIPPKDAIQGKPKQVPKRKWAQIAEEMASHAQMRGKAGEKMLASIGEFREDFEVPNPFEPQNS